MTARLFTPLDLGRMTIRNRIVSTGHDTTLPTDDRVNDALIEYHRARAKGGVGLIVSQVTGVHESARYTSHVLMGVDDGCIPGFARLAKAVQSEGAKLVVQLFHPGREIMETSDGTLPVAYAPSAVPSERFHTIPRALPARMIAEIIEGYGAAAARMERAGVNGVELVASHGYLPAQFLNPNVNLREDDWGGSPDKRARFLLEALGAMRAATGPDFTIGLRITGKEHDEAGVDGGEVLRAITQAAPLLDYVSIAEGSSATLDAAVHIAPPMFFDPGYTAPFAARVKQAVDIPVIVTGRINQPQEAEAVLSAGHADACGMTRALICDPKMPAKAAEGRFDDIRACIGCNQACIGHFHKGVPISCIQHPETGRETRFATLPPADPAKSVIVVGGGPAGMKAAAVAAARGHRVALHEAAAQLGGQALLAQSLPGRAEFGGIVTNLAREMDLAGVAVHLNSRATLETLQGADAVILATGATPRIPVGFDADEAHVVTAWDVLTGEATPGGSVVIADWRADWVGLGLAEAMVAAGRRVRLCVNGIAAGELLQSYVRDTMLKRAMALGVEVIPYARLYGADGTTGYFQNIATGEALILDGMDTLILAQGQQSQDDLLTQCDAAGLSATAIGDCMAPRTAEEAVLEGLRAGWAV